MVNEWIIHCSNSSRDPCRMMLLWLDLAKSHRAFTKSQCTSNHQLYQLRSTSIPPSTTTSRILYKILGLHLLTLHSIYQALMEFVLREMHSEERLSHRSAQELRHIRVAVSRKTGEHWNSSSRSVMSSSRIGLHQTLRLKP